MNSLVTELMNVTAKEKVLLEQSKDFLSTLAAMKVNLFFGENFICPLNFHTIFNASLNLKICNVGF
jgi:hypothetical protein